MEAVTGRSLAMNILLSRVGVPLCVGAALSIAGCRASPPATGAAVHAPQRADSGAGRAPEPTPNGQAAESISAPDGGPPPLPLVEKGACPFECCNLGEWGTYDSIPAYDRERQSGSPAFWLLPKQHFIADSANLHTLAYGVIRFRRPARVGEVRSEYERSIETPADSARLDSLRVPFAAGDSLLLLGHAAEEGELVWTRGRMMLVGWFWEDSPADAPSDAVAVLERPLVEEWWVRVTAQGRHGWIEAFRPKIAGSDGCAGIPMP